MDPDNVVCRECRKATRIIVDNVAGDMVCTECGLVLEQYMIDESAEWRKFSDELPSNDPERIGAPYNPLLTDGGLGTIISKLNGTQVDLMSTRSARWQNRGSASDPDCLLIQAFGDIATIADRLALVSTIKDYANEIYKKVADLKYFRSKRRSQDAILGACVYIACKQANKPRTYTEISYAVDGASSEDIGEVSGIIVTRLKLKKETVDTGTTDARDYVRRFSSYLGMGNNAVRATLEAVKKLDTLDLLRSTPLTIAAVVLYMISRLSEATKALDAKDVSRVSGVAEVTVRKTYKHLYPHAAILIPEWFLKDTCTDIKNLPAP